MSIAQTINLSVGDEPVPGVLQLPASPRPVAAVLLLHGFNASKTRMANSVGRALLRRGIASLAIDLPLHGERHGSRDGLSLDRPLALVRTWRLAVREANKAIQYLADNPAIDSDRIAVAGYSLGAYLAVTVASTNQLVRAVALAAGGDLPARTPFLALVRRIADPRRAAHALRGRPLFMANGLGDRTVTPEQARALYAAAEEPKEIYWYEGGHRPPPDVVERTADWLMAQLSPPAHSRTA